MVKPLLTFFLFFPLLTVAQPRFRLTGYVRNAQTNAPPVSVSILGLSRGAERLY